MQAIGREISADARNNFAPFHNFLHEQKGIFAVSIPSESTTKQPVGGLDKFFHISERGSSVGREIRAGVVTFFAMAYIVLLNPLILGTSPDR